MSSSFDQPFPTREEQYALAVKARAGDEAALAELVTSHLPLVRSIASAYPDLIELDDRKQAGAEGLYSAAMKFDPENGTPFSSYATPAIHRHIRRAIRKQLGISDTGNKKWWRIKRNSDRIWLEENREPDNAELAAAEGCSVRDVEYLAWCHNVGVLLLKASENELSELENAPAPAEQRPDQVVERTELIDLTNAKLRLLPERERQAVTLHLGWTGEEPHTLKETAALMGISLWHATRLKNLGLQRLQRLMHVTPE